MHPVDAVGWLASASQEFHALESSVACGLMNPIHVDYLRETSITDAL
jgi:hypothetical protein